ncbi:YbdK family carboxylate-amine ligase [Azoarcus olearius]|uniref:Putative glutamate--cysteine ligase 2 n=1 Tax=Azoarcus sp. (strain BH72) TaxID=418699 RepID=GCS2_AZOSB|nr:YbdK family carboxylate-amine ligase [Azoarcus olearius]A1K7T8.1 RecName: Full=Putative glutamate--cysteine ligase 2; AltName: Full=Gamma-glutamylcysteine synthetase 2; Short=GCS 2; Short=Gamma-GCS 2 [Azoarcus olearius]CAL94893.1 Glutamate-cysteine ligase [Azoarcus olearius]
MSLEAFSPSRALSIGVELELQLVGTHDYDLVGAADDMLRLTAGLDLPGDIKPEMTDSMIEISTGVCDNHAMVLTQLDGLRAALVDIARRLNVGICGGGTHGFQDWGERRIFDNPRFHYLHELYGYLAKQFTVFGQHVHIGCPGPDAALYLVHGLSRYIPHLIALSASSPFLQGQDTGFQSSRLNAVFAFPLSGRAPFALSWSDFGAYFDKMSATGVVSSMKDFYWDIRPKPEYGTVEVRVMDTPLTVERAAALAAYIQALARYLMVERPIQPREDDYLVYTFNRFQACRFGYAGTYVDPENHTHCSIAEALEASFTRIEQHAIELGAEAAIGRLRADVASGRNDAWWLRGQLGPQVTLPEVVMAQCRRWMNGEGM